MTYIYDSQANASYVTVRKGKIARTVDTGHNVNLDLNADGEVVHSNEKSMTPRDTLKQEENKTTGL